MVHINITETHMIAKLRQSKLPVMVPPVHPNRPYEQRPDELGIFPHETLKIHNLAVVERSHYTDTVQRLRITLVILDGVCISMEHKRVPVNQP